MKQFFSLLDGMMEYRQLKEAIEQGRVPVSLTGAAAAHKTHIIASLVYQLQRPALVIVPDESTAIRFAADLNTLLGERVLHFPARDYVLLDVDGASGEFEHQRLGTLSALLRGEARVVVASAESACERTIPKEKLTASILEIDQDGSYDEEEIVQKLVAMGYQHRDQVEGICQFARRGGILDIFPPDRTQPVRIEFWDDEVDSIATFDVGSQRRLEQVETLRCLPCMETLPHLAPGGVDGLARAVRGTLTTRRKKHAELKANIERDAERLEQTGGLPAADKYLPLVYPEMATALD